MNYAAYLIELAQAKPEYTRSVVKAQDHFARQRIEFRISNHFKERFESRLHSPVEAVRKFGLVVNLLVGRPLEDLRGKKIAILCQKQMFIFDFSNSTWLMAVSYWHLKDSNSMTPERALQGRGDVLIHLE